MREKVHNVLFLCTGNSARSIMAEVMLNELGRGRFRAFSAGSHPGGRVNPFAIETMKTAGLSTAGLRSKSWDEFAAPGAPPIDFVITVCDSAASETCPVWPGRPVTAHWGVADPAAVEGGDETKRKAFQEAAAILRRRIELLLSLPEEKLEASSTRDTLDGIGKR
ncbi:MAG: arsenate reductase ArsC [Usitatibacter sp.]